MRRHPAAAQLGNWNPLTGRLRPESPPLRKWEENRNLLVKLAVGHRLLWGSGGLGRRDTITRSCERISFGSFAYIRVRPVRRRRSVARRILSVAPARAACPLRPRLRMRIDLVVGAVEPVVLLKLASDRSAFMPSESRYSHHLRASRVMTGLCAERSGRGDVPVSHGTSLRAPGDAFFHDNRFRFLAGRFLGIRKSLPVREVGSVSRVVSRLLAGNL